MRRITRSRRSQATSLPIECSRGVRCNGALSGPWAYVWLSALSTARESVCDLPAFVALCSSRAWAFTRQGSLLQAAEADQPSRGSSRTLTPPCWPRSSLCPARRPAFDRRNEAGRSGRGNDDIEAKRRSMQPSTVAFSFAVAFADHARFGFHAERLRGRPPQTPPSPDGQMGRWSVRAHAPLRFV